MNIFLSGQKRTLANLAAFIILRAEVLGGDFKIDAGELAEARYFTVGEMKNLTIWPAVKKFFNKHIFKEEVL
ncbi:MAG: hypothetical protein ACM3KM_03605 [Acidobacteriaceae bacterium]